MTTQKPGTALITGASTGREQHFLGLALVEATPHPTGREAERSELKRAFCSSLSES
jgi:hypothetical protein